MGNCEKEDEKLLKKVQTLYDKGMYKSAFNLAEKLKYANKAEIEYWRGRSALAVSKRKLCRYPGYYLDKAIDNLIASDEKGYKEASKVLGEYYFSNGMERYENKDFKVALRCFEESIEYGNPDAAYKLAEIYYNGDGTDIKLEKSLSLAEYAKNAGINGADALIQKICKDKKEADKNYTEGMKFYNNEDYEKALPVLLEAAKQGNIEAQAKCGEMYYNGKGTNVDLKEALHWYENAANQDNVELQYTCGEMYYNGEGMKVNKREASYWYLKAARRGHAAAQCRYGEIEYYYDRYVRKHMYWLLKAAKQGNAVAQYDCGCAYAVGRLVPEDKQKAVYWFTKASDQDFVKAKRESRFITDEEKALSNIEYLSDTKEDFICGEMYYEKGDFKNAMKFYLEAAEEDYARAQYKCGMMYYKGEGVKVDKEKAINWIKKSIEQKDSNNQDDYVPNLNEADSEKMFIYGEAYYIDNNFDEALKFYEKSAKHGYTEAQVKCGDMYYKGEGTKEDKPKSLEYYLQAAKLGNAEAQVKAGDMYYNGEGTKEDKAMALQWYENVSEQAKQDKDDETSSSNASDDERNTFEYYIADAQYKYGNMCYNGEATNVDKAKAFSLYESAASCGSIEAQVKCGDMYYNGEGTNEDKEKSLSWFLKAAEKGNANAQYRCAGMLFMGEGTAVKLNLAISWAEKARENGVQNMEFLIDEMNSIKKEVEDIYIKAYRAYNYEDFEYALSLFTMSAEMGLAEAQYFCGLIYDNITKDSKKALEWFRLAAEQDNAKAQYECGVMYEHGKGTDVDFEEAFYWYEKGANLGYVNAQLNLGVMYSRGRGVKKDMKLAIYWFEKAANQGYYIAQYNCGLYYYNEAKEYNDKDKAAKAEYWLKLAIENGDEDVVKVAKDIMHHIELRFH